MRSSFPSRVAPFTGILFGSLLVGAFATLALVGTEDGAPASAWGAALAANGHWAQLSGFLHGLAGLALAAFAGVLHSRAPRGLAPWGRFAAFAWAASFLIAGAAIFASAEMANYQKHAEGAKTALILGHLLYANPIAGFLGGLFALSAGFARIENFPAWYPRFSLATGGLGVAATLLGSVGGIGLIGMGPLALWFLVTAVVAPVRAAYR